MLSERPGAGEGAEEVGSVVVRQPADRVVGVDGHPADRVECETTLDVLAYTHGREQLDRFPDVAQRLPTAGLVEDAVEVRRQRGRVPGKQDLAADGLAGDARGEIDGCTEEVAVALDA